MQPAVGIDRGGRRVRHFEIAEHDVVAAGAELADFADRTVFPVSGLTILVSMFGSGRPMVPALSSIVSVVMVMAATGEHSVCPNTIVKGAPSFFSSEVTNAAGTVEPPEQIALTEERSVVANDGCSSIATSMVGTAEHRVAAIGLEQLEHETRLERLQQHLRRRLRYRAEHAADAAAGVEQRHGGDEDIAGFDAHSLGGVGSRCWQGRDDAAARLSESRSCPTCTGSSRDRSV